MAVEKFAFMEYPNSLVSILAVFDLYLLKLMSSEAMADTRLHSNRLAFHIEVHGLLERHISI